MTKNHETTPEAIASVAYKVLQTRGRAADPSLPDITTAIDDSMRSLKLDNYDLEVAAAKSLIKKHGWKRIGNSMLSTAVTGSQRVAAGRRITETEVADVIVEILQGKKDGRATIADLVDGIPRRIALSMADMVRSRSRPAELVWEQQVRNIVSHRASPGNAICEGRLRQIKGGLALGRKA